MMTDEESRRGVIVVSGNHAQGRGLPCDPTEHSRPDLMPRSTCWSNFSHAQPWSGRCTHGENYDEVCQAAMERSQERHATFIHPFDDDEVIAERDARLGTVAAESDLGRDRRAGRRRRADRGRELRGEGTGEPGGSGGCRPPVCRQ